MHSERHPQGDRLLWLMGGRNVTRLTGHNTGVLNAIQTAADLLCGNVWQSESCTASKVRESAWLICVTFQD